MNIYNWIQKTLFSTYEEWYMKNPGHNSCGFHIDGINNSLKAMQDGYFMYMELYPPHAINGCTCMKAVVGKNNEVVNLYMEINGKKYAIFDLSYGDAVRIMRNFVKKSVLPDDKTYSEVIEDDRPKIKESFVELSELLIENNKYARSFLKKVKPKNMEDIEEAWLELYEELLRRGKALELDWKARKDIFVPAVKKLSENLDLEINEDLLVDEEDIPRWGKVLNSTWTDYVLAAMDVGSDSYVLMVLSRENFNRAKALAGTILNRIAVIEEM